MKRKILDILRLIWKIRPLEKMLVMLTRGKPFGTLVTKLPANHYQYKKATFRLVKRHNINYHLDLSDLIDWYIYFGFKEASRQSLYSLVKNGENIIDVGANVGDVSLHLANMVGPSGNVFSFEPDPINYRRMKKNLSLNEFSNITLNRLGLGNKSGNYRIYNVDERNQGMNRILDSSNKYEKSSEIRVITLDEYVEENCIDRVDLIKIDVEGFEFKVLNGSVRTIDAFCPKLFIELDDQNLIDQGSSAKILVQLLQRKGYQLFHSETNKLIMEETDFTNCHFDIIGKHIA